MTSHRRTNTKQSRRCTGIICTGRSTRYPKYAEDGLEFVKAYWLLKWDWATFFDVLEASAEILAPLDEKLFDRLNAILDTRVARIASLVPSSRR